jgi:uncharacterized RDD family membrane protein YckC
MSDLENIWRGKTDAQVAAAAANLKDYLPDAQAVIRAEYERRKAEPTGTFVEDPEDEAEVLNLASRGERLSAQLLDSVIAFAPFFGVIVIPLLSENADILVLPALLFCIAYLLFADALPGGQSCAKKGLGISVVTIKTRKPCGVLRSCVRNLPLLFLGIFDWIFIFGKRRQRLGDLIAGTIVVRANE